MERSISEHIEITPGTCGGRPRIAGHRIRVQDIVAWHENQGYTAEEIVAVYPTITLSDVYAALAYYYDHREEIRKNIEDDDKFVEEMMAKTPSKLLQKIMSRPNAQSDTISP